MKKRYAMILLTCMLGISSFSSVYAEENTVSQDISSSEQDTTEQSKHNREKKKDTTEQNKHNGEKKKDKNSTSKDGMKSRDGGKGIHGGKSAGNDEEAQAIIDANSTKFQQFTYNDEETGLSLEYSLFIPDDYDKEASYPLLMYIPDSTASGKSAKEIVEQYFGSDIWVTEEDQAKHPSFVLVPAFSETVVDDNWNTSEQIETAVNLLESLQNEYSIDSDRLYTTGQSMGCMTSLYLNSKYPDLFAASMFVSGQWDINALAPLEESAFFYIVSAGDSKATNGQTEVMSMFDNDGISYSYNEWSAKDDNQDSYIQQMLEEGNSANMVRFEEGTTLSDGSGGSEHMSSFNYGYKLTAVRDWLFEQ